MAEYQLRLLMFERFGPGSFPSKSERAAQFVSGLHVNLRAIVARFSWFTLTEAVMRALEREHVRESHH